MLNLVEALADDEAMLPAPCRHGNIVEGHACYCHVEDPAAPRKCPIWRHYGAHDASRWHAKGDFDKDDNWAGGCRWFVPVEAALA